MEWKVEPISLEFINSDNNIDYILAMDENGTPNLNNMVFEQSIHKIWFTLTGVLVKLEDYQSIQNSIINLKNNYWKNSLYDGKRVVFHSRDIRKTNGPFSRKNINYHNFSDDLTNFIEKSPYKIFSANINKHKLCTQYVNPYDPYDLGLEFIMERYCMLLRQEQKNGIILIESRGKKEDKKLLNRIVRVLQNGNKYFTSSELKRLKGIYFNPKRTPDKKKSYWLLEMADLISYPIHKYMKTDIIDDDLESIETKIYHYPNHHGRGLKIFPE